MFTKFTRGKVAAIATFAGLSVGGAAFAGVLPGVSHGTPPVSTPGPSPAAGSHPDLGAANGDTTVDTTDDTSATTPPADPATDPGGSRTDGLDTALSHVSDTPANAVVGAVAAGTPGPGFGQGVAAVASGGAAHPPTSTPPVSTPPQADQGLTHKP